MSNQTLALFVDWGLTIKSIVKTRIKRVYLNLKVIEQTIPGKTITFKQLRFLHG